MKIFSAVLIGILLLAGCASKEIAVTTTGTSGAPAWIDNEIFTEEQITATGIAQRNPLNDLAMQRSAALADARVKMAQKISVRVQGVFSRLDQQQTTAKSKQGKDKIVGKDVMTRMMEDTYRQTVDQTLSGAAPQQFWTDEKTGNLYVLVAMDRTGVDRAISSAASQAIRKELNQGSRDLQDSLRRMDETLQSQRE